MGAIASRGHAPGKMGIGQIALKREMCLYWIPNLSGMAPLCTGVNWALWTRVSFNKKFINYIRLDVLQSVVFVGVFVSVFVGLLVR